VGMDKCLWQRVDALFASALELAGDERQRFLERECADVDERAAVERLLAADALARSFLESRDAAAIGRDAGSDDSGEDVPSRLGPYKILGVLGAGGMGQVLLGARADDQFERMVAIKRIRKGLLLGSRTELLARFQLERRALAQLEHPNIARLYDAGQDDEGNPFLVLEYVDGLPIDQYCDQHRLSVDERLQQFRQICDAVQFAHRNLLVHRDLKPSNILVRADGRPMLLDFGIAKLLEAKATPELENDRPETRTGTRPMTPSYASPEQVLGHPITTSSDVYSLGVLLYELLTGRRPYRLASAMPYDLEHAICHEEPERPSLAVLRDPAAPDAGTAAERRRATPAVLSRNLRGDLDTLLTTALRKDPRGRYASVEALSEDIRRHLASIPLVVRPPKWRERAYKFAIRHRLGVGLAAGFVLVVGTFLALLAEQSRHTRQERDKAEQALTFLIEVFKASDPAQARGEELTAREILDGGARRIERELADQPDVQATLMDVMGRVYLNLGLLPRAERLLAESLSRRGPGDARAAAATRLNLCELALEQADLKSGEKICRQALNEAQRLDFDPATQVRALGLLGTALLASGQTQEAVTLHQQALDLGRRSLPHSTEEVDWMAALAAALFEDRQFEAAEALIVDLLQRSWRADVESSVEAAASLQRLGSLLVHSGEVARAEEIFRRAFAIQEKLLDPSHPSLLASQRGIAVALQAGNQSEEALALQKAVYEKSRTRLGLEHPQIASLLADMAITLGKLGRFDEAIPKMMEATAMRRRILGEMNREVALSVLAIGNLHRLAGHLSEAERWYRQSHEMLRALVGDEDYDISFPLLAYARLRSDQQRLDESIVHYRHALVIRRRNSKAERWRVSSIEAELGAVLLRAGQTREAEELIARSYNAILEKYGPRTYMLERPLKELANLYDTLGRPEQADIARSALDEPSQRLPWAVQRL
jgi:serine/threonine protein kinase/tetratricopeptide (TPR) repeat protein